ALALLPLWLARRACVRAFVDAAAAELGGDPANLARVGAEARAYQAAAVGFLTPVAPSLVAVGGLSGTGKTTLAMVMAPELGRAPGAIVLRTDVERKRMAGVAWDAPLPPGHYTAASSARAYAEVMRRAAVVLRAGQSVVVDAVFARPEERAAVERVARDTGVAFTGLWLEVPEPVAVSRIESRRGDASDATSAVARRQREYDLGTMEWPRLDASRDLAAILADASREVAASGAA
ncbi:MAG: AAA family ATPase, partial [Rhodospirillales bacterium]|nr:AAA family ATPase [Rhodospirillales bacterium]